MKKTDAIVKGILTAIFALAALMFFYAMFWADGEKEVYIGSFSVNELSEGWTLSEADGQTLENVTLPMNVREREGAAVRLVNTLPADVRDGMRLCFRSQRQDVTIRINGEERGSYHVADFSLRRKVPQSAFLVVDLRDADANGRIELEIVSKETEPGAYHSVTYAYGNNVWFPYIEQNLALVMVAAILILLGLLSIAAYLIIRKRVAFTKAILHLAETMVVTGMWILSESEIRQLIFRAASYSNIIAYLLIEIVGAFLIMYFDEVQDHHYERLYTFLELGILAQALLNSLLNAAGLVDYYDSLIFSHIWFGLGILCATATLAGDIKTGRIKKYAATAIGMLLLLLCGIWEIVHFYFADASGFGANLGFGLILLLAATLMQTVHDALLEREQKRLADNANRAKSSFLANMSHEIRTPINAILGMDEMILRESGERDILSYAEDIENAGKTLLSLVNDILDFSKVEEGRMEILPAQYDLSSLINDLVNMIRPQAENKGLNLEVRVDENAPHLLYGDEIRIRQCALNVLTNAVKYTEKGSVTLEVGYEAISEDKILLRFRVADTGIGLKKEDMEKLFTPFSRIEESRNRSIEGTGLGMSITKQLLELMDSALKVESVYGKGSTFSFALEQPVVKWAPIGEFTGRFETDSSHRSEYHESFRAPEARILVVDDMPVNLTVIKGLLKKTQVMVDTAGSGAEAIEKASRRQYDVIFVDHMMPEMDGIETLCELQKLPGSENTAYIALTANAISGSREMYFEAGFSDYLPKPVDSKKLEEMLMDYLPPEKLSAAKPAAPRASDIPAVLVATGDGAICFLVEDVLGRDFRVESCRSGQDTPEFAEKLRPDLILLDTRIGEMSGFEVLRTLRRSAATHDIPIVLMTDEENADAEALGFRNGASDFIRKAYLKDALLRRAKRIIELNRLQSNLQNEVKRQIRRTEQLGKEMMLTLSKAVDAKDRFTSDHSTRVATYAAEIARRMGKSGWEQELLYEMGLLHDIGKIGLSEETLNASELTDEDFTQIKRHTLIGCDILRSITEMPELAVGARSHHEHYDGTGYPDGLKGAEIPEAARILCVADSYDAMTSTRVYSPPRAQSEVRAEIERCSGTQFDPEIAKIMLQMIDEDADYLMTERTASVDIWKGNDQLWTFEQPAEESAAASGLPDWLRRTEELDVPQGLIFCGTEETYLDTLKIYAKTSAAYADEIAACFAAGDIANTAVKVHALKSTSRAVGAEGIGALAEKLEMAGKAGDTSTLEAELGGLLARYRALGRRLMPLLETETEPDDDELPPMPEEQLRESYDVIRRLLEEFEYDRAASLIDSLLLYRLPDSERERCGELKSAAENFEWDRIGELLG